ADHGGSRTLLLSHAHDGRDLQLDYAERTLGFVHRLWGRDVLLETSVNGKKTALTYSDRGFAAKTLKEHGAPGDLARFPPPVYLCQPTSRCRSTSTAAGPATGRSPS